MRRQLTDLARNALVRPGADEGYADGDDAAWREIDWPSLTRRVEVEGREVNVVDTGGDGPPLLLVHGLSGAWQNWLPTIPAFMGRYRCIAPDLPGFGGSEMPRDEITIGNYARMVDALCEKLGAESPSVVGNSMGGFVSAELAIAHPARVERLVLVDAAGISIEDYRRAPLMTGARFWTILTARAGSRSEMVVRRKGLRRLFLQSIVRYPERISTPLIWELVQGAATEGFIPALESLMGYSIRDRLKRIEVPSLVVWGENDILVPVRDARHYQRLIGDNARLVVFEDTGHMPMIERPGRFNELLADFLAGQSVPEAPVEGTAGVSA